MFALPVLIALALAETPEPSETGTESHSTQVEGRLEFSFGNSLLIREQALLGQDFTRVVPVPSVLMIAEFLVRPQISVSAVVNIPTSPALELDDDGTVKQHHAAAAIALGVAWAPVLIPISENAWFKPQFAALGGVAIRSTQDVLGFPMVATKLNIVTSDGFTMYTGASFALAQNTLGILYGVGHRF